MGDQMKGSEVFINKWKIKIGGTESLRVKDENVRWEKF